MCACLLSFCCSPQKVPVARTLRKDLHLLEMPKKFPAPYAGPPSSTISLSSRKIVPQPQRVPLEIEEEGEGISLTSFQYQGKVSSSDFLTVTIFQVLKGEKFSEEAPTKPLALEVIYPQGHPFYRKPQ